MRSFDRIFKISSVRVNDRRLTAVLTAKFNYKYAPQAAKFFTFYIFIKNLKIRPINYGHFDCGRAVSFAVNFAVIGRVCGRPKEF